MKRNKVPEKIYMSAIDLENMGDCIREPLDKYDIEYTRTDAFIERAWNWIEGNLLSSNQQDKSRLYFEQFKNYMKG